MKCATNSLLNGLYTLTDINALIKVDGVPPKQYTREANVELVPTIPSVRVDSTNAIGFNAIDLYKLSDVVGFFVKLGADVDLVIGESECKSDVEEVERVLTVNPATILAMAKPVRVLQGIYFLCNESEIVYIGKSTNIPARLKSHVSSKKIKFSRVSYVEIKNEDNLAFAESLFISMISPKYNKDKNNVSTMKGRDLLGIISKSKGIPSRMREFRGYMLEAGA